MVRARLDRVEVESPRSRRALSFAAVCGGTTSASCSCRVMAPYAGSTKLVVRNELAVRVNVRAHALPTLSNDEFFATGNDETPVDFESVEDVEKRSPEGLADRTLT